MSTGIRVPFAEAAAVAGNLALLLDPACSRLAVAGSIRRGSPGVGDIELVAVPIIETEPDGLFGERQMNRLTERIDGLIDYGDSVLASHPTDPKRGAAGWPFCEPEARA
jgi:DNA polymerase/3'-5' exonuclease PolX